MALSDNTLIAFEMNGLPLPHWNGFPARIVVPGWTGTYWVKGVTSVQVVPRPEKNFWMSAAYRLPRGRFKTPSFKSQVAEANEPITTMVVNSLITNLANGQKSPAGKPFDVVGVAWDGGYGIALVEVSTDGGQNWRKAEFAQDHGRYSFRQWHYRVTPGERGPLTVMARATNRAGATQTFDLIANPAGYHHNVVQRVLLEIV